jgi:hypothetical protein
MTTRAQVSEATKYEGGYTDLMHAAVEEQTETVKSEPISAAIARGAKTNDDPREARRER